MNQTKYLKGECQQCAGRIEFPAESIGTAVECPHCGKVTELMLAAPPQEPALPRRVIIWTLSGVLILALVLVAALVGLKWFENYAARKKNGRTSLNNATNSSTQSLAVPEDPIAKAGFQASAVVLEKTPGSTLVYAVGMLTNTTARQRFGVRIEFDLLDAAGTKAGTAKDYLSVLEPGGQWRFKAMVVESKAVSARVASVKEDQ